MATSCFPLIRGRMMRVTRLDSCGAVWYGAKSKVITDGFISVALTANTEEGTAIQQETANGALCINDTPAPVFTGYGVEVQMCNVDPDLFALLTGQPTVIDGSSNAIGFQVNSNVDLNATGFALEMWSNVPGASCSGGTPNYGYFLLPFIKGGVIGDFTVENAAVTFTISNALTQDGTQWGVGPHNVISTAGVPGPLLSALGTKNHLHMQLTTLAPPASVCGATSLGTADLTATAGTPSLPAAGQYYPLAMAAVVATPSSLWTTGQYAADYTGAKYYWNGTTWTAGIAP